MYILEYIVTNVSNCYVIYVCIFVCVFIPVEEADEDSTERVCDTLLMCIITVLNHGLRNGGGIADVLRKLSKEVNRISSTQHIQT